MTFTEEEQKRWTEKGIEVDDLTDADPYDLLALIGKTVRRVEASEYHLTVEFTDGTELKLSGARWGDCSLGIEVEKAHSE